MDRIVRRRRYKPKEIVYRRKARFGNGLSERAGALVVLGDAEEYLQYIVPQARLRSGSVFRQFDRQSHMAPERI